MLILKMHRKTPESCAGCPVMEAEDDDYSPEGYVSVPFSWFVIFCTHIEFKEPMSDAEREKLWKQKLKQQFGIEVIK